MNSKIWRSAHALSWYLYWTVSKKYILGLTSLPADPLHLGHVKLLQSCKRYCNKLLVVVNDDNFLIKKKGFAFMSLAERMEIIAAFAEVDYVIPCYYKNGDSTVVSALRIFKPKAFLKGGDRDELSIDTREKDCCYEIGCKIIYEVGGGKIQSSSALIRKIVNTVKK